MMSGTLELVNNNLSPDSVLPLVSPSWRNYNKELGQIHATAQRTTCVG